MDALRIGPRLRGTVCPLSRRPFHAVSSIPGARSRYLYTLQARHLLQPAKRIARFTETQEVVFTPDLEPIHHHLIPAPASAAAAAA